MNVARETIRWVLEY